ncbi:DNA glycosylase, partial [Myriangium duriaei CBS 260.36]
ARKSTRGQATEPQQLSSPPPTPAPATRRSSRRKASPEIKQEAPEPATPASFKSRKRGRNSVKAEAQDEELPHNLCGGLPTPGTEEPATKKRRGGNKKTPPKPDPDEMTKLAKSAGIIDDASKSASKAKKQPNYRLTPGQSPYPTYAHPTPAECAEVVRLLSKVHGPVTKPKEIRPPSLTTAGCGEVPSVLDALIRTRLSAATTGANSSRAFQSLVKTFGTLKSGIGAGSVDWNAVRLAPQKDVFEAIRCGGLADAKSKDIKAILDSVWAENQERGKALKGEGEGPAGAEGEEAVEKKKEVELAEQERLSLDHLHLLTSEEAFNKLVGYPGIGPKTASCVLLFCLQRPSFAVDTHVFRLCRYLGWVPSDAEAKENGWPKVERNTTYSHCEVRVPDEHKYGLHQLLIKHGKTCGRCRAATGMGSEGWKKGCPIEHLVSRHGAKKGG